jgi:hypothetical protein
MLRLASYHGRTIPLREGAKLCHEGEGHLLHTRSSPSFGQMDRAMCSAHQQGLEGGERLGRQADAIAADARNPAEGDRFDPQSGIVIDSSRGSPTANVVVAVVR